LIGTSSSQLETPKARRAALLSSHLVALFFFLLIVFTFDALATPGLRRRGSIGGLLH
jgi:hypothetical protein